MAICKQLLKLEKKTWHWLTFCAHSVKPYTHNHKHNRDQCQVNRNIYDRLPFLAWQNIYKKNIKIQYMAKYKTINLKYTKFKFSITKNTSCFSCAWRTILWSSCICCRLGESNSSTGIWWNFNSVTVTKIL